MRKRLRNWYRIVTTWPRIEMIVDGVAEIDVVGDQEEPLQGRFAPNKILQTKDRVFGFSQVNRTDIFRARCFIVRARARRQLWLDKTDVPSYSDRADFRFSARHSCSRNGVESNWQKSVTTKTTTKRLIRLTFKCGQTFEQRFRWRFQI